MATRPEKVRELMRVANAAIAANATDTSATEVFSAYMTMASNTIQVAKDMGVPPEELRQVVYTMLLQCDDPTLKVM